MGRTVVYKYAVERDHDFDEEAMRQLSLAHRFYNELVALTRAHDEQKQEVWREHPSVEKAACVVDEIIELCDEAEEAWQKSKVKTRDRKGDPELKTKLTELRAELKNARAELKALKESVGTVLFPRFSELKTEFRQVTKAKRQEYAAKGLYWGNYNRTWASWDRAVKAIEAKRKNGQAAELKFRRWTGEGQIGVQLQRSPGSKPYVEVMMSFDKNNWEKAEYWTDEPVELKVLNPNGDSMLFEHEVITEVNAADLTMTVVASSPSITEQWANLASGLEVKLIRGPFEIQAAHTISPIHSGKPADPFRTPAILASSSGKWKAQISLAEMHTEKHVSPLTMRTGTDEDGQAAYLTIPQVIYHRPIPADGDIADVVISRRRKGPHYQLSVEITVKLPDPTENKSNGVCGVDTGWRVLPDGSIRVAVWRSKNNGTHKIPHHLVDAIRLDGEGGEVRILSRYVEKWEKASMIRGERDRRLEILRDELVKRWDQINKPEQLADVKTKDIKSWKSPNRFAYLARIFRENDLPFTDQLNEWAKQDRKLWHNEVAARDKVINWRSDLFRVVANILCKQNSIISIEEPYVAKVIRRREDDTVGDDATRVPSVIAAPASLILAIKSAGSSNGTTISVQSAKDTTLKHAACGHINPRESGIKRITIQCEACGDRYDQDANSAWQLLHKALP